MNVWIITQDCCGEFVSAWRTEVGAETETARLNAEYRRNFGRENYSCEERPLEG